MFTLCVYQTKIAYRQKKNCKSFIGKNAHKKAIFPGSNVYSMLRLAWISVRFKQLLSFQLGWMHMVLPFIELAIACILMVKMFSRTVRKVCQLLKSTKLIWMPQNSADLGIINLFSVKTCHKSLITFYPLSWMESKVKPEFDWFYFQEVYIRVLWYAVRDDPEQNHFLEIGENFKT